ncbi:DDE-type integrase/transposase/recombinase [Micromonospora sp. NBC_00898]|uniref:DDE-type integrase/transposase/recombinase n=1 Tax=Micromonospora sp. NBC_00898 TaxID=2975981 RepID=UPI00386A2AAB
MSERSRLAGAPVVVSARRNVDAARWFFRRALSALKATPSEVVTDAAAVYPAVLDELIPSAGTTLSSTPKSDRG